MGIRPVWNHTAQVGICELDGTKWVFSVYKYTGCYSAKIISEIFIGSLCGIDMSS